mmetsp:Transcript_34712/g.45655  ORF Transcript_34712/g.45655 Transcript_34712/m.45655 type:complete len:99 (+) Transcript_34712:115-411(+)
MGESYSSYGRGKLILAQICSSAGGPAAESWGTKGGWLDLGDGTGRILYTAKVSPRELPKMPRMWPPVSDERPLPQVVVDRDGDTDMAAEEFKSGSTEN